MSRNTKLQIGFGIILLVFMMLQIFTLSEFRSNQQDYSQKSAELLRERLREDGLSSFQASTISNAVRDNDFMLSSHVSSVANSLIFFNVMGLTMAMAFFSGMVKRDEKDDE